MNLPSRDEFRGKCKESRAELATRQDPVLLRTRQYAENGRGIGLQFQCWDGDVGWDFEKPHPKGFTDSIGPNVGCDAPLTDECPSWYSRFQTWWPWILATVCFAALVGWYGVVREKTHAHQLPTDLHAARPVKRDRCTSQSSSNRGDYNTPLHIGAVFIILSVSFAACALPILAVKAPKFRIPTGFLFFVSHFGTGVLLATAFVHLLPTAFTLLGDDCLSSFWTTDYPAMPGAIALASIFFVTVVEMVFSPARHGYSHSHSHSLTTQNQASCGTPMEERPHQQSVVRPYMERSHTSDGVGVGSTPHLRDLGPLIGRSSSMSRTMTRINVEDAISENLRVAVETGSASARSSSSDAFILTTEQKHQRAVMQCFLLEMGILFHSVFIGMSLSVSVGNEFLILLIAIIFHQTFEGLALGSRIASLVWPQRTIKPWLMSLAYGCTTPLGQALGLATHTLYSPDSAVGLLVVGIMNAISAGLLIFASLVELMSEDFLSDESWRVLRGKRRVYACVLVFLGAFFMSLVGAWA